MNDRDQLKEMKGYVKQWLRERQVPATIENVTQALAELHYIDWLNGPSIYPTCEPQSWAEALAEEDTEIRVEVGVYKPFSTVRQKRTTCMAKKVGNTLRIEFPYGFTIDEHHTLSVEVGED